MAEKKAEIVSKYEENEMKMAKRHNGVMKIIKHKMAKQKQRKWKRRRMK